MADALSPRNDRESPWTRELRTQMRVLGALFLRESETRRGRRFSVGYLAAGIEPLLVILTIGLVFYTINRQAPYGHSLFLFIATGVFPIYLFIHTSMRLRGALAPGSHRKRYPIETSLDHIVVHAVLHVLSTSVIGVAFFGFLYWLGIQEAVPWDPLSTMLALSIFFLFGIGAGIINSVIARLFPPWDALWPALARGSLHFSAPYFVAAYLPPNIRWYFAANPVIHAVNWFRQSFYFFYPAELTNIYYPLTFAIVMIVVGLLLEAGMRTYLEDKE
ncbi:ABC transporter permease [Novosphingobium sp.]|uniref:ABC transporter permease n=1 Tax=Novosphingobium sp. TaxID=1874826 RepID=UPI003B52F00A